MGCGVFSGQEKTVSSSFAPTLPLNRKSLALLKMKQEEARRLIIQEWDRWIQTQSIASTAASGRDSLKFFLELQDARSALLDFQARGRDKWQVVHAWLLDAGRVH